MDNRAIKDRFRSISYVILHFSFSLIELACAFGILGLQIALTATETCTYRIGVGFWSFPFLFLSALSIWILLWKRNSLCCFLALIFHILSTLFTTAIIIISFLTLVNQLRSICTGSTTYFLSINISLIALSLFLKLFLYTEILLLHFLRRYINHSSISFNKELPEEHDQQIKPWNLPR